MEDIPGHDKFVSQESQCESECEECGCLPGMMDRECYKTPGESCGCHDPETTEIPEEEETLVGLHKKMQGDVDSLSKSIKKLVELTKYPPTPGGGRLGKI